LLDCDRGPKNAYDDDCRRAFVCILQAVSSINEFTSHGIHMKLIDVHHLLGIDNWLVGNSSKLPHENRTAHARCELTSAVGDCWLAFIMPFPSSIGQQYLAENQEVIDAAALEARFYPVLALNPNSPESRQFFFEAVSRQEVKGVMIWPVLCGIDLPSLAQDHEFTDRILANDLPVTIHIGTGQEMALGRTNRDSRCRPEHAIELASQCPKIRFNLTHLMRLSPNALRDAAGFENVFTDTSGLSSLHRWYERGLHVFPATDAGDLAAMTPPEVLRVLVREYKLGEKICFASSYPFNRWWDCDMRAEISWVTKSGLTPDALDRIFWKNAMSLYGLLPPAASDDMPGPVRSVASGPPLVSSNRDSDSADNYNQVR
jgi:predicted TIM-barrel fold metal-dependent hydrolase